MLIIVSGPSGSGKNTVINALLERVYNLEKFKTCTTREMRPGGENEHYYLTEQEFEEKKKNDEFFETEMVHQGIWYGVLKKSLDDVIKGEKHFINDIDVNGAEKISNFLLGKVHVVKVFVDSPNEVLRERLKKRGEPDEKIDIRLSRAEYERSFKSKYDLVIENIEIDATKKIVENFVEKQKDIIVH